MKIISIFILLFIGVFAPFAFADDTLGTVAAGVHGVGSQWGVGKPFLQWKAKDTLSFEATPLLNVSEPAGDGVQTRSYGVNVGVIKELHKTGGLSTGLRLDLAYNYSRTVNSYSGSTPSESITRQNKVIVGIGPAFEYFVEFIPGFSIGAHASVNYEYYKNQNRRNGSGAFVFIGNGGRGYRVTFVGELLTMRYYF